MLTLKLSLYREFFEPGEMHDLSADHTAIWPTSGRLFWQGNELETGKGHLLEGPGSLSAGKECVIFVRFTVGRQEAVTFRASAQLGEQTDAVASSRALLRMDKVSFPPGAKAWRHVHPGPGFRYLIKGKLRLQADDHSKGMVTGDCWYEAANSPVKAIASENEAETAFVRLMVLPLEFAGRRTINILSEEDRSRERLQTTTTYFDVEIDL